MEVPPPKAASERQKSRPLPACTRGAARRCLLKEAPLRSAQRVCMDEHLGLAQSRDCAAQCRSRVSNMPVPLFQHLLQALEQLVDFVMRVECMQRNADCASALAWPLHLAREHAMT